MQLPANAVFGGFLTPPLLRIQERGIPAHHVDRLGADGAGGAFWALRKVFERYITENISIGPWPCPRPSS